LEGVAAFDRSPCRFFPLQDGSQDCFYGHFEPSRASPANTTTTTTMFEAVLTEGAMFKGIIDAIKDLVSDCNLDCSEEEISIQSMDSAHVSLVSVNLGSAAFQHYRCDRPASLGINTANMAKIFKMMGKDDNLTLKAEDEADSMTILFEGSKQDTVADFGKSQGATKKTVGLGTCTSSPFPD
jgi:Proliferating cell nuclear antigen, N-terminal domain